MIGAAFEAAWRWTQRVPVRVAVWALGGAIVVQQHQINQAQAQSDMRQGELTDVREMVESQLVLECLDTLRTQDLQKAKIPCRRLFDKYGIAR